MKKRGAGFLKFIVIYKAATGISALIMSVVFFRLRGGNLPEVLAEFAYRNGLTDNPVIQLAIKQSAGVSSGELTGLAALALAVGIIDIVESVGLNLRRRWAEWMTVALTAVFIPFEVYEMIIGVSFFKGAVIVINCLIVYYLVKHKELFKAVKCRLPNERPDKNT